MARRYSINPDKPLPLISVMCAIRDSQCTRGAERELLYAICLRARAEKKYSCWPGYAQLAADTGLHPVTLKRAAQSLENKQLLRRVVRKNSSNIWFLNVSLIVELANAKLDDLEAAKVEEFEGFELTPTGTGVVDEAADSESEAKDDYADAFADRSTLYA